MKPLVFSHTQILVLWWLILIFYIANAVFLLTLGVMYFNFDDSTGILNYLTINFMYSATATFLETNHHFIGAGHVLLSVPFVYGIALMVTSIVHRRKIAFNIVSMKQLTKKTAETNSRLSSISKGLSDIAIKGKHFSTFVMVVETAEVVLQTYQAYRNSKYIVNASVNQLYAVCIFINCWSTSLIHYVWDHRRGHTMMARFLIVLADVVLDFVWGVVLQSMLLWPYFKVFWTQEDPEDLIRVPETPDRELRQILVVSAPNFLLNGFSFVTMAIVVREICFLLDESQVTASNFLPMKVVAVSGVDAHQQTESTHQRRGVSTTPILSRLHRWHLILMTFWGTSILIISIVASGAFWPPEVTYAQCFDRLHPWLTQCVSCVGRAINCTALQIQGNKTEIAVALDTISPYLLGNLAFTDCPNLEIPSAILDFSGIQTIAIRQSTLVEWNDDAAITNETFPELQSVQLIYSRVQCKPIGMTMHRFPSSFEWLRLRSTDVESFIHDVSDAWWSTHYFNCVDCGLLTLPRALDYIDDLIDLEVGNNSLTDLAVARLQHKPALRYLSVPWNPIMTLSDGVWELLSQLFYLDIQGTNMLTVTEEQVTYASPTVTIFAFDTPMCNGSLSAGQLLSQVTCTEMVEVT